MKTNVESRVFSITTLSATLPGAEGSKKRKSLQLSLHVQQSIDRTLHRREGDAAVHTRAHLRRSSWWAILCKSTRLCRCRSGRRWGRRSGLPALPPERLQLCHSTAAEKQKHGQPYWQRVVPVFTSTWQTRNSSRLTSMFSLPLYLPGLL